MVYISISFRYIGAVPLLFLHAEADEEIEGKGPGEVSATVGRHSLINVAIQYFEKKKDINRLSEAYYCQGRILSELSASEEALTAYLKAKELVRETSDRDLEALSIII